LSSLLLAAHSHSLSAEATLLTAEAALLLTA
jgi:hypothetical protein